MQNYLSLMLDLKNKYVLYIVLKKVKKIEEVYHMCQISEDLIRKGKNQGKNEEKLSIIKKMIEKNMSIEEISDIVDLSVNEIKKLLNK